MILTLITDQKYENITIGLNLEEGIKVVYLSNSRSVVSNKQSMLLAGTDSSDIFDYCVT